MLKRIELKQEKSIIEMIKNQNLPLVMWGGGSMSYSIRKILKMNGISVDACWIDNSKEGEELDGIPVLTYEKICEKYSKFNVVFGHSKYELADEIIRRECIENCFCLVNVCYGKWSHLSYEFVKEHLVEYQYTIGLLNDELSKECLIAFLNCKINEDFHYLLPVCKNTSTYFNNPFFSRSKDDVYVDAGAYDGDTIREFLKETREYTKIYAIEPEKSSLDLLKKYIKSENLNKIEVIPYGLWNKNIELSLSDDKESSSINAESDKGAKLKVFKLDDLLSNNLVNIIKINYLIGVEETIKGAKNIIKSQKPNIVMTVGFDEWTLLKIPRLLHEMLPEYKLDLRFASAMPARLLLYAYV